jgi:L,D-transpeptidase YcbB
MKNKFFVSATLSKANLFTAFLFAVFLNIYAPQAIAQTVAASTAIAEAKQNISEKSVTEAEGDVAPAKDSTLDTNSKEAAKTQDKVEAKKVEEKTTTETTTDKATSTAETAEEPAQAEQVTPEKTQTDASPESATDAAPAAAAENLTPENSATENSATENSNNAAPKTAIKSILNSSGELTIEAKKIEKDLLKRIYESHAYKPIFLGEGKDSAILARGLEIISKANENGLNKSEFDVETIKKRIEADDKNSSAKTDILITQSILDFIEQVRYGRKIPKDIGFETFFKYNPRTLNKVDAFAEAIKTDDLEKFILNISSKQPQYIALRAALKKVIEEEDEDDFRYIDDKGDKIKPGTVDYRIPLIRQRLKAKKPLNPKEANNKNLYDSELLKTVIKFQQSVGIDAGGVIDKDTIKRLNIGKKEKVQIIKMNMERWRWLPDNFGANKHIVVGLAEYRFRAYENNELEIEMPAIVGRAKRRTPIMTSMVLDMTFQPFWYVPRNYATELLIPKLRENNRYLEKDGILVYQGTPDGGRTLVDPTKVDWNKVTPSNYNFTMQQNPSEKNVLGQVKFAMLNDKEIFMHGTSEPEVFSKDLRAISAGCIRVEDPLKVADWLAENNTDSNVSLKQLEEYYTAHKSGKPYEQRPKNIRFSLNKKIPIYVVYFTATVDDAGELKLHDDVYEVDSQMATAFDK